ncbi:MAG TPA: ADP-polyphosphate phosphotransferase [Burkholderiales bacterium]|nr:ADP-polyphosphate phosphotransferase [Burkholderiales bacterium]
MKIETRDFRVRHGAKLRLEKERTKVRPYYQSEADYERRLTEHVELLRKLQPKLYAHNRYALLVILQAMDAAGKDGVIKHVMSGVNPQGCEVHSFKHPSEEVLEHDFLWNASRHFPERGRIGIFNRSYYEEVLIVRVHRNILDAELLPDETRRDGSLWRDRYRSIREIERHLHDNGTRVVKLFLHISKEEQCRRFLARLEEPDKNWKLSAADLEERKYWDDYMQAYAACLSATSTKHAPWYVVPADDKKNARLIVSQVILDTLSALPLAYPEPDAKRRAELKTIRSALLAEERTARRN